MKKILLVIITLLPLLAIGQIKAKTETGEIVYLFKNGTWLKDKDLPIFSLRPVLGTTNLEIPEYTSSEDLVIKHTYYILEYSKEHKQARWVAYKLWGNYSNGMAQRKDKFVVDPNIPIEISANNKDYKGSGYDRGHLLPSANMTFSQKANDETFYYSNISPQAPEFNRGIWKSLEELERAWAQKYEVIYVVTGGVLNDSLKKIGNGISVPNYFYKAILRYEKNGDIQAIGFCLPNKSSTFSFYDNAITIDSLEKITGINFFANLPDYQEEIIESFVAPDFWDFNANSTSQISIEEKEKNKPGSFGQCKAITQNGTQCKRNAQDESGYCWQHKNKEVNTQSNSPEYNNSGRTIYTGPRGGKYYINSKGKKVYVKKK